MSTDEIRAQIDGVNQLLQENIRVQGPEYRARALRNEIRRLHQNLHEAVSRDMRTLAPAEARAPRPPFEYIFEEAYGESMRRAFARNSAPRWEPRQPPNSATWMYDDHPSTPKALTYKNMRIVADALCPNNQMVVLHQVVPIRRRRAIGFDFTSLISQPTLMGEDYERVEIPGAAFRLEDAMTREQVLGGLEGLRTRVAQQTGHYDISVEMRMSPESWGNLSRMLESALAPLAPVFVLGPESERFSDQMDVALQEFQKARSA